jgi:hypothetical protein
VVAVGRLDRVWLTIPEDVTPGELQEAFYDYFGAKWREILDAAEKTFAYNIFNNAYFSVRDVQPVENLTLDQILENKVIGRPPNIIVS